MRRFNYWQLAKAWSSSHVSGQPLMGFWWYMQVATDTQFTGLQQVVPSYSIMMVNALALNIQGKAYNKQNWCWKSNCVYGFILSILCSNARPPVAQLVRVPYQHSETQVQILELDLRSQVDSYLVVAQQVWNRCTFDFSLLTAYDKR